MEYLDINTNRELIFFGFKAFIILLGLGCIFMGYKLFTKNTSSSTGEIEVKVSKVSATFKNAAPGTFFCLLGAGIIITALYKINLVSDVGADSLKATSDSARYHAKADSTTASMKAKGDSGRAAKRADSAADNNAAKK